MSFELYVLSNDPNKSINGTFSSITCKCDGHVETLSLWNVVRVPIGYFESYWYGWVESLKHTSFFKLEQNDTDCE